MHNICGEFFCKNLLNKLSVLLYKYLPLLTKRSNYVKHSHRFLFKYLDNFLRRIFISFKVLLNLSTVGLIGAILFQNKIGDFN